MSATARASDHRPDLIGPVHKALRRFMFDTLIDLGALDVSRRDALQRASNAAERLLDVLCEPAVELRATLRELRSASVAGGRGIAARAYRELCAVVTERLQRMAQEEDRRNPLLWLHYSDRQLQALRAGRMAALSADELRESLEWMCDALRPDELAAVLADLQACADAATCRSALDVVTRRLDEARWSALRDALELPAEPLRLAA